MPTTATASTRSPAPSERIVEEGYTAFKVDVDHYYPPEHVLDASNKHLMPAGIHHIVAIAKTVRETIGYEIEFGLDCHWSYNVVDAITVMNALEPYELAYFEDPVGPDNVDATLALGDGENDIPALQVAGLAIAMGNASDLVKGAANVITGPNTADRWVEAIERYSLCVPLS